MKFISDSNRRERRLLDLFFKTDPEDASLADILDRILENGIVLDPWIRLMLGSTDLRATGARIVVAAERRRKPFIVQPTRQKITNGKKPIR